MQKSLEGGAVKYSAEAIDGHIAFLADLIQDGETLYRLSASQRLAIMKAAGQLSRPDRLEIRKRNRDLRKFRRRQVLMCERRNRASTGIRTAREVSVFTPPPEIKDPRLMRDDLELKSPQNCYVCKVEFRRLHFFYDQMCPDCAAFNYAKRFQTASLEGQIALITGARLKIGYQATLMMLRAGARVIATTRFPVDAAFRYSRETDFDVWKEHLQIYGLDLRHTPSVEIFCRYVQNRYDRLDLLINNAAQTVRRPSGFYAHIMPGERQAFDQLPVDIRQLLADYHDCKRQLWSQGKADLASEAALPVTWTGKEPGIGIRASAALSQIPYAYDHALAVDQVFPQGKLDADLQQVDLRKTNSWRLRLGEIETSEMFELQLINAIAPFVLCNHLTPMMKRDHTGQKHVVNVSAMEGKFHRFTKTDRHPHTNMAKAALNMLTHTSASDLAKSGIFMNAVDTGWVTDEDPAALVAAKQAMHDFQPPLDIVDGAARVCDPFFNGMLTGKHWCGKFLKDYFPVDW